MNLKTRLTLTLMGTLLPLGVSDFNTIALTLEPPSTVQQNKVNLIEDWESLSDAIARISAYQWSNRQVVILRVRDIPVLMFVSPLDDQDGYLETVNLAKKVVQQINQVAEKEMDAHQITVAWDEKTKGYSIKIKEKELVQINSKVLLPDTTHNLAHDALQATNRLRRLLGNAVPLTEVANLPLPPSELVARPSEVVLSQNRSNRGIRRGVASWYGPGFHGRRTANGERYNQYALTAAHRSFPFGTKVRVTNLRNGRSVIVRINDRGPYVGGRIIDLSAKAAKEIGMFQTGVAPVEVEIIGR